MFLVQEDWARESTDCRKKGKGVGQEPNHMTARNLVVYNSFHTLWACPKSASYYMEGVQQALAFHSYLRRKHLVLLLQLGTNLKLFYGYRFASESNISRKRYKFMSYYIQTENRKRKRAILPRHWVNKCGPKLNQQIWWIPIFYSWLYRTILRCQRHQIARESLHLMSFY